MVVIGILVALLVFAEVLPLEALQITPTNAVVVLIR